jgi:hypothetical protein
LLVPLQTGVHSRDARTNGQVCPSQLPKNARIFETAFAR